jgi:acyl-phosphate glycerol 3-phosphate acyltransferase
VTNLSAVLSAYAVGSVVWGVVLGRFVFGHDLRERDNPGASGSVRTFGPALGAAVGLLDLGKGFAAVHLARWLGASPAGVAAAAGAAVAGHNWPVWFAFRGGGGLATATGALAAFGFRETATGVTVALLFALVYKHPRLYGRLPMSALPFGSLFGLPLLVYLFWRVGNRPGALAAAIAALAIGIRALGMYAGSRQRLRNP